MPTHCARARTPRQQHEIVLPVAFSVISSRRRDGLGVPTMRWKFADDNNPSESAYRQLMLDKFDSFWRSFEKDLAVIRSSDLDQTAKRVSSGLGKVSTDLFWELSPEINGERRFVITPENNYFLHPLVETMLERAPSIPGFRFMAYREPIEPGNVAELMTAKLGTWISDIRIAASASERNAIDLVFTSDSFSGQDNQRDLNYCFALCEVILGQRMAEEWIGKRFTRSTKPGLLKRMRSLLGKGTEQADVETVSMSEFREDILHLRDSITAKLPDKPVWVHEPQLAESSGGAILEFKNSTSCRATASTVMPQVILGASSPPLCFTPQRFSRFSETFCYLKSDESSSVITEESLDRGELEDAFDKGLRASSVGCVTGGGWGPVFNFIDFAISDLNAAIPVLRHISSQVDLPKRTWLRFLDPKLNQEWIGMYEETPEPDTSPGW